MSTLSHSPAMYILSRHGRVLANESVVKLPIQSTELTAFSKFEV